MSLMPILFFKQIHYFFIALQNIEITIEIKILSESDDPVKLFSKSFNLGIFINTKLHGGGCHIDMVCASRRFTSFHEDFSSCFNSFCSPHEAHQLHHFEVLTMHDEVF